MNKFVGLLHVITGLGYLLIGYMLIRDRAKDKAASAANKIFGLALIGVALTCAPHHLTHGYHVLRGDINPGIFDFISVAAAAPFGAIIIYLRNEVDRDSGPGDRLIKASSKICKYMPVALATYMSASFAWAIGRGGFIESNFAMIMPSLILLYVYSQIGYWFLKTQYENKKETGFYSLSGCSFGFIFPTCTISHLSYIYYVWRGDYVADVHTFITDVVGAVLGVLFVVAITALKKGWLRGPV